MRRLFISLCLVFTGMNAFAMASGSVVFDPANYSQTLITAGQSVKLLSESVGGNLTKLRQLQELYKQGRAIASGDVNAIAGVVGGPQLQSQIRDMQGMKKALTNLNGNIDDLTGRYNYTMQMSQKYGVSVQEYQAAQARRVSQGIESARLEQQQNMRALKSVDDSYVQLQKWQERLPETNTELMQMMNMHMTMLNTNNAQVLSYMARNNAAEQDRTVKTAAEEQSKRDYEEKNAADAKRHGDDTWNRLIGGFRKK
ncbi:hypothetical protein Rfer_4259 (plasmid) [Rhodoferax ferrireducens T118]|uniref:Uncharacterized protein n=1 Tax=Albidiferax ferrireducens (strain ATCC BAA-621 / DSM 15236 / T118) TaxID=338969 RepID=Q21QJ9_ALBFT|nr:hypothetical protein [Rhodoferax ferrireducens]ABD71946.1 hypothetical protein Rfer_4259 [Rhodoferax ferrireducens T118]